uniref:Uncharacterized protein n=1 Tax=Ditylenchus dipsaci TaxID=166011 RepID=A0A915D0Z4_9BILA
MIATMMKKAEFKYSKEANQQKQKSMLDEKANYWRLHGEEATVISDYKYCLLTFNKAYEMQPINALTLSGRATCYLKLGQPKSAFLDANEACIIDPLNIKAQTNKVLAMIALKLPREAIMKELDRTKNKELIKRYSQEPEEDHESSIKYFTKSLEKGVYGSPDYIKALINRGTCYYFLKNYEDAYIDMAQVIDFVDTPSVQQSKLFLKGTVLFELKRYEAIPTFERAISVNPGTEVAEGIKETLAIAKKPQSLALSENLGMDSEFFNMAIRKKLLECSLAIFPGHNSESKTSDIKLEVEVLVTFCHEDKMLF